MGRYDGEDYASRSPCPEGQHQRAFNGSCHVCKILCTGDGLSLAERERRDLRAENERLRAVLAEFPTVPGSPQEARVQAALSGRSESG